MNRLAVSYQYVECEQVGDTQRWPVLEVALFFNKA